MRGAERGFLLLSSSLGDPMRRPLSTAQMRILADRSWQLEAPIGERDLALSDLQALGYGTDMARRILQLLSQEAELDYYLQKAKRVDCQPVTRISEGYPLILRKRLGLESPGVLWAKGDLSLLKMPAVALVGSRNLSSANGEFARQVGCQAAKQGFALVSGNARGADKTAQEACLEAGGCVISVIADSLAEQERRERVLYLSEEDYDQPFSPQRAHSRNRVIHCLGYQTFVAQSEQETGGTWAGTAKNLRFGWSPVFCFRDGSEAISELCRMGAQGVTTKDLQNLNELKGASAGFFDE